MRRTAARWPEITQALSPAVFSHRQSRQKRIRYVMKKGLTGCRTRLSLSSDLAVVRRSTWSSLLLPLATLPLKIDRQTLANTIRSTRIYSPGAWQSKHATLILIIRQPSSNRWSHTWGAAFRVKTRLLLPGTARSKFPNMFAFLVTYHW